MAFSDELFAASADDETPPAELRALLRLAAIRFRAVEFEMSPAYLDLLAALRAATAYEPPDPDEPLERRLREDSETKGCG